MPVTIKKKKGGKYSVKTPGGVKAKGTTLAKAEAQARLLRGVEHGFMPTGKKRGWRMTDTGMMRVGKKIA